MQQLTHLSEEELVLHLYRDDDAPAAADVHLQLCDVCREQFETLRNVLALVDAAPIPERGDDYGAATWNRLRWHLGSERRTRRNWVSGLAAAAVLAMAFFAGQFWNARRSQSAVVPASQVSQITTTSVATQTTPSATASTPIATASSSDHTPATHAGGGDRLLVLVVSDHLDSTERVLLEVANADPKKGLDFGTQSKRAEELVASNRIYRQSASQQGDARIASLLSDVEPVLVELSHAGNTLSPDELVALQKRIDAKGLLFKVRVVGAQVDGTAAKPAAPNTNSL